MAAVHLSSRYLLSNYYVPGTVPDTRNCTINKVDKAPFSQSCVS